MMETLLAAIPGGPITLATTTTCISVIIVTSYLKKPQATPMLFLAVGMCCAWSYTTIGGIPGLIFCLLTPAMAWLLVDALKPNAISTVGNFSSEATVDTAAKAGVGSLPDPREALSPKKFAKRFKRAHARQSTRDRKFIRDMQKEARRNQRIRFVTDEFDRNRYDYDQSQFREF